MADTAADAFDAGVGGLALRRRRRHHLEIGAPFSRLEVALGVAPLVEERHHLDGEVLHHREVAERLKLQSTEFATSLDLADKGQYEAYVLAWSGRADPDGNIFSFDACKQPLNYAGYCKPEVDEILTKSRTTRDPAERRKLFEQLAAIVLKDRPIVYLYHRNWLWAHTTKLTGLRTVPDGLVRVQGVKLN